MEVPEIAIDRIDSPEELEKYRKIYNLELPPDLPAEITCRLCGKPKQLVKVNKRVAFWAHMDAKTHTACPGKLTFRTSFIQDVAKMWGHWVRTDMLMKEDNYAAHWETAYADSADKFLRNEFELTKVDRRWLYEHLDGPVVDVGCGNCIDYEGFKGKGYMGVDVTPSFLEAAVKLGVPKENVTLSDARKMPFKDKQYKSGYLKDVLLHYKQPDAYPFIDELIRVCEHAYIVWGYLGDQSFMPSSKPKEEKWSDTFWYNVYDLAELEKRYVIMPVGDGTTITRVEPR